MSNKGYKAIAYHELCRLCAQSTSRHIEIFSKEGRLRQVAKNIEKLLCINIKEVDPLPKTICSFCLNRVEDFREFHSSCLSASQFLHTKLPTVDKASGKCYVSVGLPVRPTFLKRKMARLLKVPIELNPLDATSSAKDLQLGSSSKEDEEVEVREYEECVQQPKSSDEYNADVFLKLLEDTMNTDCLLQDHDYLSIDELLGHDTPKGTPASLGKHIGKVMPVQDHDYLSSYENSMTPNVMHQELLDHNYFTSLGPFADNFVNLLSPEEEDKFIEHNYVLPSAATTQNLTVEKPESPALSKSEEVFEFAQEQCEQCGNVFAFYQSHDCSADRQRQCEACGDMFWTTLDFFNHSCSIDSNPVDDSSEVQCEVCGSIFNNVDHHDCLADYERLCHRCGLVFQTFNNFDVHVCKTKKRFSCQICKTKFMFKINLRNHILKHLHTAAKTGLKEPYTCKLCGASYKRRAFFKQHLELKHCSQVSANLSIDMNVLLETKCQRNTLKMEYKCDRCAKMFSNNCNLLLHRQMHKYKHTCQVCNAKFLKQSDYAKHVMSHLNVHKFQCDDCDKGFDSEKCLKNHKIRHNANRKIKSVLNSKKQIKRII